MGPVLVSVIIPVYNGARFLGEALASVAAQHGVALEALVVDDGSDDGSAELAERWGPPIRCLRQRHAGIASARNAGIRAAAGELLAFLDADDVWTPGWLRVQADRLAGDPALDVVFGLVEHFRDADAPPGYGARAPLRAPGLLPGAMLIRRASFFRVGLFDETRPIGEFIDWQLRAQELGLRREIVPIVALRRRIHGANTTVRLAAERGEYVRVLRAALERRRAAGQA